MALQLSDLKFYKSAVVGDTPATNGGGVGTALVATGVKNNIFPDVSQAERAAGVTRWRKLFATVANAASDLLSNGKVHLVKTANGDDIVSMYVLGMDDFANVQAAMPVDGYSPVGVAKLKTSVTAGATSFVGVLESSSLDIFTTGTVWLGDANGGEYFDDVTISVSGTDVTITLVSGQVAGNYSATDSYVSAVKEITIAPYAQVADTFSVGSYSNAATILHSQGVIFDVWTLTFTSPTAFTVAGALTGALASGVISADYAPANPATGKPYFTLGAAGWTGPFVALETMTVSTWPAAVPIWLKQLVPAGAQVCNIDTFELILAGETA